MTKTQDDGQTADFFVSYTRTDRAWAVWIAWQLEAEGYRIVIQAWDFVPGRDWLHEMQRATAAAARVVVVLSPAYLASAYGEAEWRSFLAKDPSGEQGLLLPIRVAEVKPPGLLKTRTYADLVGLDAAGARTTLLAAASGVRGKPSSEPEFPGLPAPPSTPGLGQSPRFPGEPSSNEVPVTLTEIQATLLRTSAAVMTKFLERSAELTQTSPLAQQFAELYGQTERELGSLNEQLALLEEAVRAGTWPDTAWAMNFASLRAHAERDIQEVRRHRHAGHTFRSPKDNSPHEGLRVSVTTLQQIIADQYPSLVQPP